MRFTNLPLQGACIVELEEKHDDRGFFARGWCAKEFEEHGLVTDIAQINLSFNRLKGTLRGMHYQVAPYEEVKVVRCIRGALFDVIVDLRRGSPTFMRWVGVELSAVNRRMLYVPAGFAHGFQTLEDATEALYQVSEFYSPGAERGLRFDDPSFAIKWPTEVTAISDKDANWPDYVDQSSGVRST